jgi:hypothetical protein
VHAQCCDPSAVELIHGRFQEAIEAIPGSYRSYLEAIEAIPGSYRSYFEAIEAIPGSYRSYSRKL